MKTNTNLIKVNLKKEAKKREFEALKKLFSRNLTMEMEQQTKKFDTKFKVKITGIPIDISKIESEMLQHKLGFETKNFLALPLAQFRKPNWKPKFKKDTRINGGLVTPKQLKIWVKDCHGQESDLRGKSSKYAYDLITECFEKKFANKKNRKDKDLNDELW